MSSPSQQTQDLSMTAIQQQQHQQQNHHSSPSPPHTESPIGPTNSLPTMLPKAELLSPHSVHGSPDSPQPELATMTNVNVLDLHTENKIYDKDTVFIYDNPKVDVLPPQDHVIDARLTHLPPPPPPPPSSSSSGHGQSAVPQILTKIEVDENQIIRIVGPNGEQQQIISREIINGEHHILSRNEAGEHILTRIVSDPSKLLPSDATPIFTHTQKQSNDPVYQTDPLDTSVLQYQPSGDNDNQQKGGHVDDIYDDSSKKMNQIVYSHGGGSKDLIYEKGSPGLPEQTKISEIYDHKPPIDLIYEDGNKTVIYTTSSDQKALEIYSAADLQNLVAEGQVVVQSGGLQYTTTVPSSQSGGQAVFVVSDQLPPGIQGSIQR